MPVESLFVILAAFSAGLVDAMVGGGGLILVPALFSAYPGTPPATLFGTNKSASIWGTLFAAIQYQRRIHLDWQVLTPAAVCALTGSLAGAWAVTRIDPEFLRRLLPFILLLVLLHTLRNKALGTEHHPPAPGFNKASSPVLSVLAWVATMDFLAQEQAASSFSCSSGCWATTSCTPLPPPRYSMSPPTSLQSCCLHHAGTFGGISA